MNFDTMIAQLDAAPDLNRQLLAGVLRQLERRYFAGADMRDLSASLRVAAMYATDAAYPGLRHTANLELKKDA